MYFKRAHRVETQQNIELMTFAATWSTNTKNQKNLYLGSFNYFSYMYTIQIGSNWYMDTGVRDLEVALLWLLLPLLIYVAKIYQIGLCMLC